MLPEIAHLVGQWTVEKNLKEGVGVLPDACRSENAFYVYAFFLLSCLTIAVVAFILEIVSPWPLLSTPRLMALLVIMIGCYSLRTAVRAKPGTLWPLWLSGLALAPILFFVLKSLFDPVILPLPDWMAYGVTALVIAFLLYIPMAVVIAIWDLVPLDSRLARFAYAGRFRHLRDLHALATRLGWDTYGPAFPRRSYRTAGQWNGRHAFIESGVRIRVNRSGLRWFYFNAQLSSEFELWPVAVELHSRNRSGQPSEAASVRLWAPKGEEADQSDVACIRSVVNDTFLPAIGGIVFARPVAMVYSRDALWGLPTGEQVAQVLGSLETVLDEIEARNLCYEVDDGQEESG